MSDDAIALLCMSPLFVALPDMTLPEEWPTPSCPCGSGHADGGCPAPNSEPTAVER